MPRQVPYIIGNEAYERFSFYGMRNILTPFLVTSFLLFYTGLFLIALGSGGIKPLVVSFVGDQFDQMNKHIAEVVFDAFYRAFLMFSDEWVRAKSLRLR